MVSKTQRHADLSIDEFVRRVAESPRVPLWPDEVPEFLRDGPPDAAGQVRWTILPTPVPPKWVEEFEAKLPGALPRSYKSLITRYLFPVLDVGRVTLFGNSGTGVRDELVAAVFRDQALSVPLLRAALVQFGRPSTGSYDAVCFDVRRRTNSGECPVVQVDHEAALIHGRVQVVAELAPSFLSLLGM